MSDWPTPKPEPRVWVAYRHNDAGMVCELYIRTARVDILELAADRGLRYAHVPRSADLVEAVRAAEPTGDSDD